MTSQFQSIEEAIHHKRTDKAATNKWTDSQTSDMAQFHEADNKHMAKRKHRHILVLYP